MRTLCVVFWRITRLGKLRTAFKIFLLVCRRWNYDTWFRPFMVTALVITATASLKWLWVRYQHSRAWLILSRNLMSGYPLLDSCFPRIFYHMYLLNVVWAIKIRDLLVGPTLMRRYPSHHVWNSNFSSTLIIKVVILLWSIFKLCYKSVSLLNTILVYLDVYWIFSFFSACAFIIYRFNRNTTVDLLI